MCWFVEFCSGDVPCEVLAAVISVNHSFLGNTMAPSCRIDHGWVACFASRSNNIKIIESHNIRSQLSRGRPGGVIDYCSTSASSALELKCNLILETRFPDVKGSAKVIPYNFLEMHGRVANMPQDMGFFS